MVIVVQLWSLHVRYSTYNADENVSGYGFWTFRSQSGWIFDSHNLFNYGLYQLSIITGLYTSSYTKVITHINMSESVMGIFSVSVVTFHFWDVFLFNIWTYMTIHHFILNSVSDGYLWYSCNYSSFLALLSIRFLVHVVQAHLFS